MRVKNINGTSDNTCRCGSWLAHWQRFSGMPVPMFCAEATCTRSPEVGAHVQKEGPDNAWYIVPLCSGHNAMLRSTLTIAGDARLVTANVAETCGSAWIPLGR